MSNLGVIHRDRVFSYPGPKFGLKKKLSLSKYPSSDDDPTKCFQCEYHLEETEDCKDTPLCEFGGYTDYGNCVYHSDCCQTVWVESNEGVIGHFSKIYVPNEPYVYYSKTGYINYDLHPSSGQYIHYRPDLQQWVVSDNYYDYDLVDDGTGNLVKVGVGDIKIQTSETHSCPDQMTLWKKDGRSGCHQIEFLFSSSMYRVLIVSNSNSNTDFLDQLNLIRISNKTLAWCQT